MKRNYAEAIQWARKAAARGSEKGRLGLGLAYRDGKRVERDYAQAYHWLDLAALQGNTNAIAARDDLFQRMTPEQCACAGAVARPRLAKYDSASAQSAGSCVMSSYAIAANHFTGLPVTAFFEGYCHHFGIAYTNALDAKLGLPASFYIHHSTSPPPFPIPHPHSAFFILPSAFTCGPQLFVRDPGRKGFHAISGLQDIGKLVDSVLYVAK